MPPLAAGTVPAQPQPQPPGNLGKLFPVVTPSPAVSAPGPARRGTQAEAASLASGAQPAGTGKEALAWLAAAASAAIAVTAAWMGLSGPARRRVSAVCRAGRRGR